MDNKKVLDNLENICLDNVFMLYDSKKDNFKHYVMARNTNDLYYLITDYDLFREDEFKNDCKDKYMEIKYYDEMYTRRYLENIYSFKDIVLNYGNRVLLELEDSVNTWNNESRLCCRNLDEEDVYDLGNYFLEREGLDNNLLDKFIKNNRVGIFEIDDGYFLPDLFNENNFILLPSCKLDYYQMASTLMHEAGHAEDYNNFSLKDRELYSYISPYKEVNAELVQNRFNNFLVDEDICSPIGNYLKKSQLYTMYYYFDKANYYFNNNTVCGELIDSVQYSVGLMTAFYLNNYKDRKKDFYEIHKDCYDASLISGVGMNEEKIVKVLRKEINSIR